MIKTSFKLLLFPCTLLFFSCEEKMTEDEIARIGIESCRKTASFISTLNFDPSKSAFSTSEHNVKGLALVQLPNAGDTIRKIYQKVTKKGTQS